jgi:acyl-CoA synthetase (AMP-forming)/AMP-acid ligase II
MTAAPTGSERIDSLLAGAARHEPERPALVSDAGTLAYGDLDGAAERLARRILESSGGPGGADADLRGARIAIIAPNVPALAVALFAASWLQAVAVPLHARLREHELRSILRDAEPALVLSVPAHLGYSFLELLTRLLPGLPTVRSVLFLGPLGEVEGELRGAGSATAERLDPRFAAVLYTSGTTGTPRGALVSHARELVASRHLAATLSLAPADVTALVVPIAHAFGLTCLLATVASGGCALLVHSTFSPQPLLAGIRERGAGVVHGPPMLFAALLKGQPGVLAGLRGFVAGAPPGAELLERLDGCGATILNLYGLTEAGAVSCCEPDDPPALRATTAGRPLPGLELRIGEAAGETPLGELELRGPAVTPGYLHGAGGAEESFTADGWLRTGDLATIADGRLRIAGRSKELVNVGGFNVFPAEVEAVLSAHPDVAAAAVVGVQDERLGEALHAFVVARGDAEPTPAGLLAFARERLAGYKLPYAIRVVESLPLLPSGKVDRRALMAAEHPGPPPRSER